MHMETGPTPTFGCLTRHPPKHSEGLRSGLRGCRLEGKPGQGHQTGHFLTNVTQPLSVSARRPGNALLQETQKLKVDQNK